MCLTPKFRQESLCNRFFGITSGRDNIIGLCKCRCSDVENFAEKFPSPVWHRRYPVGLVVFFLPGTVGIFSIIAEMVKPLASEPRQSCPYLLDLLVLVSSCCPMESLEFICNPPVS